MTVPHDDANQTPQQSVSAGFADNGPRDASANRFRWRAGGRTAGWAVVSAAVLAILMLCLLASCTKSDPISSDRDDKPAEECYATMQSAMDNVAPTRLGITASMDHAVSRLNDWYLECGKRVDVAVKLKPETHKLLDGILSKSELENIKASNFSTRDVRHIRNALLMQQIAKFAPGLSDKELDKAVDIFYYIVRNIELIERPADSVSLPPFRILLFGRGTAEDRAWIFADVLRQLRIPAVILRPNTGEAKKDAEAQPFLVGVLLNERVYLFDTRLGLPIPAAGEKQAKSPLPRRPATLAEFISTPSIAKELSVGDKPYPLSGDDLKEPLVQLVGHRSLWSERMKKLNYSQIGKEKPLLFDELDADTDGLIGRVTEFGKKHWKADAVRIWPYPEKSFHDFENLTDEQNDEIAEMQAPLNMPVSVSVDSKTGSVQISRGSKEQLQARIKQLMGDYNEAIKQYISVRGQCILPQPLALQLQSRTRNAIQVAMEDGWVWIGTIKLEQQDRTTTQWLESQIQERKYSNSKRFDHAKFLLALAYRREGKFSAATTILDRISDDHPQKTGFALLARRWRRQNAPANTKPEPSKPAKKKAGKS